MLPAPLAEPAQTLNYLIAGYAVIFGAMLIYLASLVVRWRNLRQDLKMMEELEKKDGTPSA